MNKNYCYSVELDEKTEELFKKGVYLGQGNNGIVYELPKNKIIKIFLKKKICDTEANTLKKTKKSKYFPSIYYHGELYIIREKVDGERLDKYIKRKGMTKDMTYKIYKLIQEFKKLKFKRLDTRCRDIYVTKKGELKLIDPKGCYTREVDFPRHLMKKLKDLDVLEDFLNHVEKIDKAEGEHWRKSIEKYFLSDKYLKKVKRVENK
ncbi:protein kinase [uncultured Clostridium sp.]|uniref:protein kinase n=1 Tax=uncultured Clostridium sp. TaxID=59620 RepID=UPI00263410D4|nr:protein kinase [uncultured Clostridium sp.]